MKPKPFSALNHFTVPCAILGYSSLVVLRTHHLGGVGLLRDRVDSAGYESGPNAKTPAARIRGRHERSRSTATATTVDPSMRHSDAEPAGLADQAAGLVKPVGGQIRTAPLTQLVSCYRDHLDQDRDRHYNDQVAAPTQQPSN